MRRRFCLDQKNVQVVKFCTLRVNQRNNSFIYWKVLLKGLKVFEIFLDYGFNLFLKIQNKISNLSDVVYKNSVKTFFSNSSLGVTNDFFNWDSRFENQISTFFDRDFKFFRFFEWILHGLMSENHSFLTW